MQMASSIQRWDKPPVWNQHPLVRNAAPGDLVIPYAIYFDGVKYGGKAAAGRQQSFYIFSVANLATGARRIACICRRHRVCKCGCQG
eukprot:8474323-Alexandrium_andersonii.AAC.1